MKQIYTLEGNLRRVGVEKPSKPEPVRIDLSKATIDNKLSDGCGKIFQDPNTSALYIVQGTNLYKAQLMINDRDNLELRDKEHLTGSFQSIPINGRVSLVSQYRSDEGQMCFQYNPLSKKATLKEGGYFGKLIANLNPIELR